MEVFSLSDNPDLQIAAMPASVKAERKRAEGKPWHAKPESGYKKQGLERRESFEKNF